MTNIDLCIAGEESYLVTGEGLANRCEEAGIPCWGPPFAAAQKYGMFLCVQDLTCPGYSFLHSASLAARIPTVAAIEGNARQYCPEPNKKWANHYPGMFEITDGTVETALLNGEGLGF